MSVERSLIPRPSGMAIMPPRMADRYALAAPTAAASAPSDWQRYLMSVANHKWLVLAFVTLGTLAGMIGGHFMHPLYAARATLWVEAGEQPRDPDPTTTSIVQAPSWVDLVRTPAVLDSVVRARRLYVTAENPVAASALGGFEATDALRPGEYSLKVGDDARTYALSLVDGPELEHGSIGDSVGRDLGFAWAPKADALPPGEELRFSVVTPYDAALNLAQALKVRLDPGSNMLHIELRGAEPTGTAATVNAVVDRVVATATDLKKRKYQELVQILGKQYTDVQSQLNSSEKELESFRVRTLANSRETGVGRAGFQNASGQLALAPSVDLRLNLDQMQRDRAAITNAMSSGGDLQIESLMSIPAVVASKPLSAALEEAQAKQAELRSLRYKYLDASAPVIQAQAALDSLQRRTIPQLARQLVADLSSRERALAPTVDSTYRELQAIPPLAMEEGRLERSVTNASQLASDVGQRYESARLALLSSLPDLRVLDPAAASNAPVNNYRGLLIGISFMASLGLVVVGVTVRDRIDPKVRYPEQVTREMRLPILAAVPHVSWRRQPTGSDVSAEAIEALRALRVRVLHAHGVEGPLLLTITSPSVGEGKSFVSANLALSFAHAGYKTLLIDGDVRRGAQHRVLGAVQTPGLTDVLAGEASFEDAIQTTDSAGLSFLGSGTRMETAPELLLSPNLRDVMTRARATYGVVIVDSPPLVAGVDPLVLATLTGNLLVVLRSGVTDIALAMAKLDVADSLPVRTIGAVLNDVRGRGAFREYTYDLSTYGQPDGEVMPRPEGWRRLVTGRSS